MILDITATTGLTEFFLEYTRLSLYPIVFAPTNPILSKLFKRKKKEHLPRVVYSLRILMGEGFLAALTAVRNRV